MKRQSPAVPTIGVTTLEWVLLLAILAVGAWLRFSRLDLLEFKSDEAVAAHLALQFVKGGVLPVGGLMSSVGVTNPPLFIYLLIPIFMVTASPAIVSCFIAALGLGAVVLCWHIGRKYYGATAGLVAAAMFAVSPWAVIYSRKIWAQDFVPVFATAAMWAVHALVVGKRPKAIFWASFLPLCVIQIHFSGLAMTGMVLVILLLLRPRIDWRWATAGVALAILLAVPYVVQQSRNNWLEFRKMAEMKSGRHWRIPPGMTIHPETGYPLPRRSSEMWVHALAIMNAGEIEDVLGLSKDEFYDKLTLGDWVLVLQRWLFVAALVFLGVRAARALRWSSKFPFLSVEGGQDARTAWIVVLWCVVPLLVFAVAGLWTYLSYFAILYPAHFLASGALIQAAESKAKETAARVVLYAAVAALLVWNIVFMTDLYKFVAERGGARGTYGTVLAHKRATAQFLAERSDVGELMAERRLAQMDRPGALEMAQFDLPFLASLDGSALASRTPLPTNVMVLVVDENRVNFDPRQVPQLAAMTHTNFGPMRLYFVQH